MEARTWVLLGAVVALALSGCLATGPSPSEGEPSAHREPETNTSRDPAPQNPNQTKLCQTVDVPSATAGSEFTYDARGVPFFPLTTGAPIVDWEAIGDEDEGPHDNALVRLPSGSRVQVAIAEEKGSSLDLAGKQRAAHQITYWADHPNHSQPIAWADEWLDIHSSRLVDVLVRNLEVHHGDTVGVHLYGDLNRPGLLMASLFWDDPMQRGQKGEIQAPETFLPDDLDWDNFTYHVTDTYPTDQGVKPRRPSTSEMTSASSSGSPTGSRSPSTSSCTPKAPATIRTYR